MQNNLNEQEEYSDLVDENDNVVGRMPTAEARRKGVKNMRVVNAFLINSKGELWIPRRAAEKEHFPLCLDFSFASHVSSGETYEEALKREAQEELNIDIDEYQPRLLGQLTPKDGVMFMKVYEIKSDKTPNYAKEEFCEDFWLTPQELVRQTEQGEKSKKDLPILIKRFYL
mgnify:FL=1